jgi:type II secretory ATPase GspE/PulE/Tfp pilus assembly ATPase PilB-like protein
MAIHELLEGTDEIKRLIQLRQPTEEIRLQARRDSMTTLKQDGIVKVFKGLTDIRQVRSVCIK